jgi:hypothetical protein
MLQSADCARHRHVVSCPQMNTSGQSGCGATDAMPFFRVESRHVLGDPTCRRLALHLQVLARRLGTDDEQAGDMDLARDLVHSIRNRLLVTMNSETCLIAPERMN